MKKLVINAAMFALFAGLVPSAVVRGDGAAAPSADEPHKIALIDMARVFKQYKKFEAMREELKGELTKSEDRFKAMAESQSSDEIVACATAAFREASDSLAVVDRIEEQTGVKVRVTPVVDFTRWRSSSPSDSMSSAVAVPVLMRKLQCFSDTVAPPRISPRHPAASISSHAFIP